MLALLAALAAAICSGQAAAATLASTWGTLGNGPGQLSLVNDIDVDADGLVYVADPRGEVDVFTPDGVYQRSIGSPGAGAGQFAVGPYSVAIGRNGDVYATGRPGDTPSGTLKVLRFAKDGTFLGSFGAFPTTSFAYVAASPAGPVYVSWNDPNGGGFGDYRHVRFDADGGNETPFGPTDLQWGRDIAVTDDGQTVVLMGFNAQPLVALNADGSVRARFGTWVLGGAPGTFVVANALAVVGQTVFVTDSTGQNPTVIPTRVHRYTLDGAFEGFAAEVPEAQRLSWGSVAGDCAGNLYLGFYGPAVDRYTGAAPTCAAARSVTGTIVEQRCTATSCKRTGLAGVTVAATGGPEGPVSAVTGKDGTYALQLKEGSWTLTPSLDDRTFDPSSRPLDVRGDVTGVDFKTCAGAKAANGRRLEATEPCPIDLVVEGIELTNGIQEEDLLDLSDGQGGAGRPPVPTGNIPLVAGRTLAVRVYVSTQALRESLQDDEAAAAQGATKVPVLIEVRQGSRVLRRVTQTISTVAPWPVLPAARTNLLGSVATLVVPAAEVGAGRVVVSVKLNQGADAVDECETAVCTANNDVEVLTEAIRTTPPSVFLIPLKTATEGSVSSSWVITNADVERIWPIARGSFRTASIRGSSLDITRAVVRSGEPSGRYRLCVAQPACSSALEADLNAKLKTWWIAAGRPAGQYIALVPDLLGGYLGSTSPRFPTTWAQPRVLTPLHELMHQLGFGHADTECGGGSNGESQDPAWPEGRGVIRGYAIDFGLNERIGRRFGTFGPPGLWYDVMSYCRNRTLNAGAPDTWASTINWGRMLALLSGRSSLSRAPAASAGSSLFLDATVQADGTATILGLTPTDLPPDAPAAAPTHTVIVRNAAGEVVASLPVAAVAGREGQSPTIEAIVPAAGAARIEIASLAGDVLASRTGSTTPLAVTINAPTKGARVAGGKPLAVRWTAAASDGVELQAAVDLSLDGGRTWRTLAAAIEETTATIPAAALSRATGAQLRVRVTDGLVERPAVVTGLRLAGAAPRVRISTPLPAKGATIPAGSTATLTAVALDDSDRPITGKRLRWLDGTKPVGTGGTLRLASLKPGTHRLVLVATDRYGRSARATLTVKVTKR